MDAIGDDEPEVDLQQGFGAVDPWPERAARAWRARTPTNRGVVAVGIVIGIGVLALLAIQLFATWFGPCLHGAC
ncbi:MAG: hypothetical protein ABI828_01720 [Actinomycetota bacterium]